MKNHVLISACSLLLIAACQQSRQIPAGPWDDTIKGVTFTKEIPRSKIGRDSGKYDLFYRSNHFYVSSLGLDSLEGGYNSFQLRVWLGPDLAIIKNVVIISNVKQQWQARVITYKDSNSYDYNDPKYVTISKKEIITDKRNVTPSSGWAAFIKEMLVLQVLNLPNGNDIAGYGCGIDGTASIFETATANNYRYYYYYDPGDHAARFWQAKNVLEFAGLLEKEFGFSYTK